ncbi:hypothetical protein [Nocardia jiangsuensis]|uniref:Phosphopantetheine adenylyltransferase n=1 Tax=Nocardia jiangsuensis TaxID=1691563 RepID=A0ABV8E1D1_9NOCA
MATVLFVAAGVVTVAPAAGVGSAEWISGAYGLKPLDADLALLLRHRAVLFGVLGTGLIVAAVRPRWRPAAVPAGAVALLCFPLLAVAGGPVSAELTRVAAVDVAAVAALGAGVVLAPRRSARRLGRA